MNQGYIKLWRRLKSKGYYTKSQYVHLWIHLLLSANHKETEFVWNGKNEKVKPGQFITGRRQLSEKTGIPETTIERILSFFANAKNGHQIGQQKNNKFRLITIYNWKKYQDDIEKWTSKRTTGGQPADTNKNEENEKKREAALLKQYFSSLCLKEKKTYAEGVKDTPRLAEFLKGHTPEEAKKIFDFYFQRKEPRKVLTINAALSAVSLSYYEAEKSKKSWQEE